MSNTSSCGPFLVTADGGGGLSRQRTRSDAFVAPSRGVRVPAALARNAPTLRAAATLVCRDGAVLTDVSAALAWGVPLPPAFGMTAHEQQTSLAVPSGASRPKRTGVRGRRLRLPAEHLTEVAGLIVTTPARTWLDCAASVPVEYVVAMGDNLLHRRLCGVDDLKTLVRWARRRRGVVAARTAIPLLDGAAESPGESIVRFHLVTAGLPRPVCNLDIFNDTGWIARADLAWPDQRVIVEFDGRVHLEEHQRRSDAARRNLLQDAGWIVVVFTWADLRHPWTMVELVRSALESRGHRTSASAR